MKSTILVLALALSAAARSPAKTGDGIIGDFRLLDQTGASHELYRYSSARAIVVIGQGNGCPIIRQSFLEIEAIKRRYADRGVVFFFINANTQDTRASVAQEAADFGVDIPILLDRAQLATRSLGMTRTAEAVLIDPARWRIVYQGAVDDRLSYLGAKAEARRHYLTDALDQFLGGRRIKIERSQPAGCLYNFSADGGSAD